MPTRGGSGGLQTAGAEVEMGAFEHSEIVECRIERIGKRPDGRVRESETMLLASKSRCSHAMFWAHVEPGFCAASPDLLHKIRCPWWVPSRSIRSRQAPSPARYDLPKRPAHGCLNLRGGGTLECLRGWMEGKRCRANTAPGKVFLTGHGGERESQVCLLAARRRHGQAVRSSMALRRFFGNRP